MKPLQQDEEPIVVHAPMTGDPDRVEKIARPLPAISTVDTRPSTIPAAASPEPAAITSATERVLGLDALRGILLLAMNFTFTIPPWGPFAKWMYHTQVPPSPTRAYVEVPGLTWQDFLFAMFVFTMAAAIPIAMGTRLAKGKPYPDVLWVAARRAFYLLLFALLIGHVNPYWTNDYTKRGNVLALLGLLVSFAVFLQPPRSWKPTVAKALRYAGWIGVVAVLFVIPLLYGQAFAAERRDHIMSALAFCTLAGTVIWLFTRQRLTARLVIFGVIVVGRMAAPQLGWLGDIWYASPLPWFYQPWYLDLLVIVIPGTIAGDLVSRWMRRGTTDTESPSLWPSRRLLALAAIGLSFAPTLTVGLYERRYPFATTVAIIITSALLVLTARGPRSERDRVLSQMFGWAAVLLVFGMLVEPLEGGVKKDPQTLGFLLLMAGTATASLGSLLILADIFSAGARRLRPIALIGQNALFAYVIFMLGFEHLLWLTGMGNALTSTWQLATLRSVMLTFFVAVLVWLATKKRLIWKA